MSACPVQRPALKMENKDGKRYVTVEFERPGWQRFLGADRRCERTFGLDAYGQEVYDGCDGHTAVRQIVRSFAHAHHLSVAEAEVSVTLFLKTLMTKGLIGVPVPEPAMKET